MIDTTYLRDRTSDILKSLRHSGVLTDEELKDCAEFAFGIATAKSAREVENYTRSLATMKSVALLRATRESEKALMEIAWTALDILAKVVLAAI